MDSNTLRTWMPSDNCQWEVSQVGQVIRPISAAMPKEMKAIFLSESGMVPLPLFQIPQW